MSRESSHRTIYNFDRKKLINILSEAGVCSKEIDKCKHAKPKKKDSGIPYCHLYYTIDDQGMRIPCRQGAIYGCRENNEAIKQNKNLNLVCNFYNDIKNSSKKNRSSKSPLLNDDLFAPYQMNVAGTRKKKKNKKKHYKNKGGKIKCGKNKTKSCK